MDVPFLVFVCVGYRCLISISEGLDSLSWLAGDVQRRRRKRRFSTRFFFFSLSRGFTTTFYLLNYRERATFSVWLLGFFLKLLFMILLILNQTWSFRRPIFYSV